MRPAGSLGSAAAGVPQLRRAALGARGDEPVPRARPELEAWHQEDVASTAGLARGVVLGLVLAPLCWLLPVAVALGIYALLR